MRREMLRISIAAVSFLFLILTAAAAQESPACLTQTRLCDEATGLLAQCQSRGLNCGSIDERMNNICLAKTLACVDLTHSVETGQGIFRLEDNETIAMGRAKEPLGPTLTPGSEEESR
jgi:hypothetical protein